MEMTHASPKGAILFIVISLVYIILYFFVQHIVFKRLRKNAEHFCEQAEQDGRKIIAKRRGFRYVNLNKKRAKDSYAGNYVYLAPNGKEYKTRWYDPHCQFYELPPDTLVVYLEKWNYRIYYTEKSLTTGKHGPLFQILFLSSGFLLYFLLFAKIIKPLLFL